MPIVSKSRSASVGGVRQGVFSGLDRADEDTAKPRPEMAFLVPITAKQPMASALTGVTIGSIYLKQYATSIDGTPLATSHSVPSSGSILRSFHEMARGRVPAPINWEASGMAFADQIHELDPFEMRGITNTSGSTHAQLSFTQMTETAYGWSLRQPMIELVCMFMQYTPVERYRATTVFLKFESRFLPEIPDFGGFTDKCVGLTLEATADWDAAFNLVCMIPALAIVLPDLVMPAPASKMRGNFYGSPAGGQFRAWFSRIGSPFLYKALEAIGFPPSWQPVLEAEGHQRKP